MDYLTLFKQSGLTYTDIAHELGCCELTARKKINGNSKITKAEQTVLDNLFKGDKETCTISRHNR
jgi:predicted transcriptional regulator